ncbi:hypothetical protein M408DRAFT_227012 [Serendipita vermifera MAFF 305830]|uniref:Uncharacterized protein n=1 Tax=Serendipita vermifera MAFF 305830 TaxID=933852 RepID=A0A0C3AJP0_SERVB|nr:hypothetical protein M408DRAFT_227012 [Serendipita vermifera MAFF 305830]
MIERYQGHYTITYVCSLDRLLPSLTRCFSRRPGGVWVDLASSILLPAARLARFPCSNEQILLRKKFSAHRAAGE